MKDRRSCVVLLGCAIVSACGEDYLSHPDHGSIDSGVAADLSSTVDDAAILAGNPIVVENSRPGTASWSLAKPAVRHEIEGYASRTSVAPGETIDLYVNTPDTTYTIEVFRLGHYGGLGARRVMAPVARRGRTQPIPAPDSTGLIDCAWQDPYSLAIPADGWVSGYYLARLTAGQSGMQSYIPFVVRDDARASTLLFQSSVATWQAYNRWGQWSLYASPTAGVHGRRVSFNRPYLVGSNPLAAPGVGSGELLTNDSPSNQGPADAWEYVTLRWLESRGYDVSYATDIDTHQHPERLLGHKGFLVVGHDEYWTWSMRDGVEAAVAGGVSLAVLSSDTSFWQIRLEPSPATGDPDRVLVGYKEAALSEDPYALDNDPFNNHLITTAWRNPPVDRPEGALFGVMFVTNPVNSDLVVADATHWIFAGTGLATGDKLPGLLGYEVDRLFRPRPAGLDVLAHSTFPTAAGSGTSDMTIYTQGNAIVFATGSMWFNWGLDDFSLGGRGSRMSAAVQQMVANLLARIDAH